MVWLVGLNKNLGGFLVTAPDAPDNLSQELKSVLFRGEIGEAEAGVGLDNAYGGKQRQIETFSDGLGANKDVEITVFNLVIKSIKSFGLLIISIETSNVGTGEEFLELGFEELSAETFMDDIGAFALGAV